MIKLIYIHICFAMLGQIDFSFARNDKNEIIYNRQYYQKIIVKKEDLKENLKYSLEHKLAKDKMDYYQHVLTACLEFDCSNKLIDNILKSIKKDGKYNRKNFILKKPETNTATKRIEELYFRFHHSQKNKIDHLNHLIGYLAFFGHSEDPSWKKEMEKEIIYILDKPHLDGKIIREINYFSHGRNYKDFNYIKYSSEDMGIEVISLKNHWFGIKVGKKKGWVHSSQVHLYIPIDAFLKRVHLDSSNQKYFYKELNMFEINFNLPQYKVNATGMSIHESKWINGVLWLKVRYGQDHCVGNFYGFKELIWFRPFAKDGTKNYFFCPSC